MTYLITCHDKTNSLDVRLSTREKHLNYIKNFKEQLIIAGPILDKNKNPIGTVLILNYDNIEQVNDFLKKDPYNQVNLFKKVSILEFKKVL